MSHNFPIRVYYEDTDMAGIVYYANYLRYIERARSDWVRSVGIDQNELRDRYGIVFVVRRVEAGYLAPARFDDELTVKTEVNTITSARLVMDQQVVRGSQTLFTSQVTIVSIDEEGRLVRLPANIRLLLH